MKSIIDQLVVNENGQVCGIDAAVKLITHLLTVCEKVNAIEVADWCRIAIAVNKTPTRLEGSSISLFGSSSSFHSPTRTNHSESILATPTVKDIVSAVNKTVPHTAIKMDSELHSKNFAVRFDHEMKEVSQIRNKKRWSVNQSRRAIGRALFGTSVSIHNCDYEDVTDASILRAPICDFEIIQSGEPVPEGFYRLSKNMKNKKAVLNSGVTGMPHLYLCLKKCTSSDELPITALMIVFPNRNELVPPGYTVVKRNGLPFNLNTSTSTMRSEIAYICYRKDFFGNPIVDVQIVSKLEGECPNNFTRIDRSQKNTNAHVNIGSSTSKVYLAYRVYIERLECLWNESMSFAAFGSESAESTGSTQHVVLKKFTFDSSDNVVVETEQTKQTIHRLSMLSLGGDVNSLGMAEYSDRKPARLSILGEMRTDITVVDSVGELVPFTTRRLLHPILAALYIRTGSADSSFDASVVVLDGLTTLLTQTDLFEDDLVNQSFHNTCTISMIDLCIDAACDHFESTCQVSHQELVIRFLDAVVTTSKANLSLASIHRIFKVISFIYSCHFNTNEWVQFDFSPPRINNSTFHPSFDLLKTYITSVVSRCESDHIAHSLPSRAASTQLDAAYVSENYTFVHEFVLEFVDDVVDSVIASRLCETACRLVSKQSLSVDSSEFFTQVVSLGEKLFATRSLQSAFLMLCIITKRAWQNSRKIQSFREVGNETVVRFLGFEALIEFCECAGGKLSNSKIMGYLVRRLVVSCILSNANESMRNHRLFTKVMQLITVLWKVWRTHIRMEFAVLTEYFVIKVLEAPTVQVRPEFQMSVIDGVVTWFERPYLLLEMFVNFDMDKHFVSNWNIFSYVIRALCSIAKRNAASTGAWEWKNSDADGAETSVTVRECNIQALDEVARIAKTMMDSSGHAYLIATDSKFKEYSTSTGYGWEDDATGDETPGKSKVSVKSRRAYHEKSEELLEQAKHIYAEKDSLKKAIEFLIDKGFLAHSPQEIANFVRIYKSNFDPVAIGDYLGEGGRNDAEELFYHQIRFCYTRAVSFAEMNIEHALRLYLTECGFRLPGEGQKVDRLVEVFTKAFWQDNNGTSFCPFSSPDTVHIIAYAIILLNTDLHRVQSARGNRTKKMTKSEFCSNLRGIDQGVNLSFQYLSEVYDSILLDPIILNVNLHGGGGYEDSTVSATSEGTQFLSDFKRGVRDAEDLMRSLASFVHPFQLTGIDTNISLDLVSFMFESVYKHFLGVAKELLSTLNREISITFAALNIINHCLCSCIFLGLKSEMLDFARILLKFKYTFAPESGEADLAITTGNIGHLRRPAKSISNFQYTESWFDKLQNLNQSNALDNAALIQGVINDIKEEVQKLDAAQATKAAVSKIEKRAKVLEENSFFVREGDLIKLNRSGGKKVYRYFLFSDYLLYAHQNFFGEYVVHTKLSLINLFVTDVENTERTGSYPFKINHPDKSFVVVADSPIAKYMWVKDIQQTASGSKAKRSLQSEKTEEILARIEGHLELQTTEVRKRSIALSSRVTSQRLYNNHQQDSNHSSGSYDGVSEYLEERGSASVAPRIQSGDSPDRWVMNDSEDEAPLETIPEGSSDTQKDVEDAAEIPV